MTYLVISIIAFTQGVVNLSDLSKTYMFKDDFRLSPSDISIISGIIVVPWVIKPLWGYISDSYPICGYRRKTYLVFLGLLQSSFWILLAYLGFNLIFVVFLILTIELCIAFCNVLGEAILVEISRDIKKSDSVEFEKNQQTSASNNVSLFFGVKYCGIFLTAYLSGFLLEHINKQKIFLITAIFPLFMGLIGIFLPEKKHIPFNPIKENISLEEENIPLENPEQLKPRKEENNLRIVYNFIKKSAIYKPIIFIFCLQCTPSTSSAMFYFYTEELKFDPEFLGQLKLINSIASLLGITIYNLFFKNVEFKKIFVSTSIICILFQFSLLLLIFRLNSNIGIPDKYFCICDSLILNTFSEINLIPILVFACRLCPKNVEGTMYALMMSTLNGGSVLSNELGAFFMYILGITETNLSKIWILIIIGNLFIIILLPFVICMEFNKAQKFAENYESSVEIINKNNEEINKNDMTNTSLNKSA